MGAMMENTTTAAADVATALQRAQSVFSRRPEAALHDDAPASARWESGTRIVASHANGTQISSDMPCELGGTGDRVSPGWLFRAGIASCSATTIAMAAAAEGIDLTTLEVQVGSRTDSRGLLGMADADGKRVSACPRDYRIVIRIAARGVSGDRLRAVVDEGLRRSPMQHALKHAVPATIQVEPAD